MTALFIVGSLLSVSVSHACLALGRKEYPFPQEEVAVIIWDEKNKTEHFIRQAKFDGKTKDFAFIVPVPSTPELEEAPAELFTWLHSAAYQGGRNGKMASRGIKGGVAGGVVEVVKTQEVAGMDASVIRSSDPKALENWLNENGYTIPKGASSWIAHYVEKKWEFVAFKIKSSSQDGAATVASPLVRISFKTPRIVYPYRETKDRRRVPKRELSLYVLAPFSVVGSYESIKPWKTSWDFTKQIEMKYTKTTNTKVFSDLYSYLNALMKRPGEIDHWNLAHFRNNEEIRPYAEDLFFDPKMN
ncbi:MAG: DUF2330 domain-containing protein [Pseudobdellovibrionaceae bacterium]